MCDGGACELALSKRQSKLRSWKLLATFVSQRPYGQRQGSSKQNGTKEMNKKPIPHGMTVAMLQACVLSVSLLIASCAQAAEDALRKAIVEKPLKTTDR